MIKVTFSTGDEVVLNPSFRNIAEIGDASELVKIFATVHLHRHTLFQDTPLPHSLHELIELDVLREAFRAACIVLSCCCDDDLFPFLGGYKLDGEKVRYQVGTEDPRSIITLAQKVLVEGMVGHPKTKSTKKSRSRSKEFNVPEFVHMAVAGLGIPPNEAWELSMAEFVSLMEAKYPPSDKDEWSSMTTDEYNAKCKAFDELKARHARAKNNGR